jgi:hypothetical protein
MPRSGLPESLYERPTLIAILCKNPLGFEGILGDFRGF